MNSGNLVNRISRERRRACAAWVVAFIMFGVAIVGWCRPAKIVDRAVAGMSKSDCMEYAEQMCDN